MEQQRVIGRVKWFDDKKGYGFIRYHAEDYFVYWKDVVMDGHKTLEQNATVEFTINNSGQRPRAVDVRVVD